MRADLRGLVERIELSTARGLIPLFEAVSNAMDAVAERFASPKEGQVTVELIERSDLATAGGDPTILFDGFRVIDNGVGFNEKNMTSFGEAYTLSKINLGGRGVGRFTYLKVFQQVHIRSVFERDGGKFLREFPFTLSEEMSGADAETVTHEAVGTTVTAKGINAKYQVGWPRDAQAVARRITEHFLIRFAARAAPPIILRAPSCEPIDLYALYDTAVQPYVTESKFDVEGTQFGLQILRARDRNKHEFHLCANGREVTSGKLRDLVQELPDRLVDEEGHNYTFIALVTGEYLDAHANRERTSITFQVDDALDLDPGLISKASLSAGLAESLRAALAADLSITQHEKVAQIERFVESAPEYRPLMHERYRPLVNRIRPGLSDVQLDEELLHLRRQVEDSVRKEERSIVALMEKESIESYEKRFDALVETVNDISRAKLAEYVAHRRVILDLLEQGLKRVHADASYPLERVLHKIIFPMRATSKDIFFEQQNLWVLDERLSFHTLLISDKQLRSIPGMEGTSSKEPDVFAFFYDHPTGISQPGDGSGGIVIVEFKRPGRNDYDKDPADQIIQRINDIDEGNVRDIDGRPVNPNNLRYAGYLIADLTSTLKRHVKQRYNQSADGESYFYALPSGRGVIEILSYDRVLRDAKQRNRILFDKLGLHKE